MANIKKKKYWYQIFALHLDIFEGLPPDCENVRAMLAVRRLATAGGPGPGSRQMAPCPGISSQLRSSDMLRLLTLGKFLEDWS